MQWQIGSSSTDFTSPSPEVTVLKHYGKHFKGKPSAFSENKKTSHNALLQQRKI